MRLAGPPTHPGLVSHDLDYALPNSTYLSTVEELILTSSNVLLLAAPGAQHGCLQSTTVREGESPWSQQWNLVDGVQVDGGFFFRLTAGQESDTWRKNEAG